MLGYCDGPVSVDEVPLAPVHQVLPLPLLAVLFAQLGHYHDPRSAGSVRKATGIIAATAARRLLSHRCDPACANKVKPCSTKLLAPPPPPLLLIIDLCALPGHCVGFVGVGEVPLVPTSCSSASPRR
ncbi:hypothetical protein PF004_g29469 [Phytophthora fragariae]|uniref:Uncharacterized protein n=1 Tax=Phytophthora fragariae TaxID=53985 RepID=A0A6G0MFG4_9STRA|nr:hypothetical protein PF004_g29469 [Phytophthora fragariae]